MKKIKNQKGFAIFEVLFFVLVVVILVGAAYYVGTRHTKKTSNSVAASPIKEDTSSVHEAKNSSSSASSAADQTAVVSLTETAYAGYLKVAPTSTGPNYIADSGYFAQNFTSIPGGEYDKLLCDQDIVPASVKVTNASINGDNASVDVTKVVPDTSAYPSFKVNLVKTNNKWLISSTDCTEYIKEIQGRPQFQ